MQPFLCVQTATRSLRGPIGLLLGHNPSPFISAVTAPLLLLRPRPRFRPLSSSSCRAAPHQEDRPVVDFTAHAPRLPRPAPASAPVGSDALLRTAGSQRKSNRKASLKRVALIAQAKDVKTGGSTTAAAAAEAAEADGDGAGLSAVAADGSLTGGSASGLVRAACIAGGFHMTAAVDAFRAHGFDIDPDRAGFEPSEVVHARAANGGDIFVFPSGSIVTWSLPLEPLARQLHAATQQPYTELQHEMEDFAYVADPTREKSVLRHDRIVLGTRREAETADRHDTTLAKIAFSSGLARSTQLAVLEVAMAHYFETARHIPDMLARGSYRGLTRTFIMRRTAELVALRGRLNYHSELTDSVPDLLWEASGLDTYYDQVGKALDVSSRIRSLNQKMDYANEVAAIMRQISSERHSTRLEVIIILLIFVEVLLSLGFGDRSIRWYHQASGYIHGMLYPRDPPQTPTTD